jgi:S1-C subfamily serine protease
MGGYGERRVISTTAIVVLVLVAGLIIGGITTAYLSLTQLTELRNDVSALEGQVSKLSGNQTVTYQNITIYQNSTALIELYESVKDSVVMIQGKTSGEIVQGSGFVYNYSGAMFVITNNHVVHDTTDISVTFLDGNAYAAQVNGTDAYSDLAVLHVEAPESEFKPLDVISSSTLSVGEPVIAIGNPYGLVGSLTTGVVSALRRTISEDYAGGFAIANVIQTSAPINPGNSGGPLLNYMGKVVGITTAIVSDSQGLGFAIPSNTIRKEIQSLITNGRYESHSYLGLRGISMDYDAAQDLHVNITYGWRVTEVTSGGPSYNASVQVDDIIVGINGTTVRNGEEMSSYLEENTLPNEQAILNIRRGDETLNLTITLGKRPPPPV